MNAAPQHAYELRITIGGESWDYVKQAIEEISQHIRDREPGEVGVCSGGGGGCRSIDLQRREVSPEQYRKELEAWRQKECTAKQAALLVAELPGTA